MKGGSTGKKRFAAASVDAGATLNDTGAVCVPVGSRSDQPAKSVHPSCEHAPMKAKLDASMWCIRCAAYLGEAH